MATKGLHQACHCSCSCKYIFIKICSISTFSISTNSHHNAVLLCNLHCGALNDPFKLNELKRTETQAKMVKAPFNSSTMPRNLCVVLLWVTHVFWRYVGMPFSMNHTTATYTCSIHCLSHVTATQKYK